MFILSSFVNHHVAVDLRFSISATYTGHQHAKQVTETLKYIVKASYWPASCLFLFFRLALNYVAQAVLDLVILLALTS